MSLATRNYWVITEGSDAAERLVDKVLEPAADFMAGEDFATSDLGCVDREQTFYYEDEHSIVISFAARRMGLREDDQEGSYVSFNLRVAEDRPWQEPFYWPEEDIDAEGAGELLEVNAGLGLADDEEDEDDIVMDGRLVQEVTEYYIDNSDFAPRKLITWNYYDEDGDLVLLQSSLDPKAGKRMLDEDPDTDIDLQIKEACLSRSFSERDSKEIIRLLGRLGVLVEI